MNDDIPQPWQVLMERRGIPASYRGLGHSAKISHEAARRVVRGWSVKAATVKAVAGALGVDVEKVYELRGEFDESERPWEPPASASYLSHDEREALSRLITLMVQDRAAGKQGEGHERAAASTRAGVSPAQVEWDRNAEALRFGGGRRLSEREVVAALGPKPGEVEATPTGEVAGGADKRRRRA